MALSPVDLKQKRSGGKGGLFGKIAGGIAGAIGGAFAGQPLAGAALGSKVGGTVGGLADPGKISGGRGVPLQTAANNDPEVQLATLMDTKKLLEKTGDIPEPQKQEPLSIVNNAIEVQRRRLG